MGDRLKDRGAVVTGAGRGIGKEIALALAAEGAKVVVVDPGVGRGGEGSDMAPADEVVAEIRQKGGVAVASHSSVADFRAAEGIIRSCVENFGRLDILVNPAGILRERMIWNLSEEDWDAVIKVHLYGTYNMCHWAADIMRQQRSGRIINVTSPAWLGTVGQSNYGAAKGGIVSFTRALARELGRYGVTANVLAPGMIATRMMLDEGVKAGMKKRLEAGLITQREYENQLNMPGPEHIPPIVVYLATDEAANFNGRVFGATKGKIALYSEPVEAKAIFNQGEIWSLDRLIDLVPNTLMVGYTNPAPAEAAK